MLRRKEALSKIAGLPDLENVHPLLGGSVSVQAKAECMRLTHPSAHLDKEPDSARVPGLFDELTVGFGLLWYARKTSLNRSYLTHESAYGQAIWTQLGANLAQLGPKLDPKTRQVGPTWA